MALERLLWIAALALFPAIVLGAYALGVRGRRLYSLSAVCGGLLVLAAALPLIAGLRTAGAAPGETSLSIVLVPFSAMLWLVTIVVTPNGRRDDAGLARSAASCLLQLAAFLTVSPALLAAIWIATSALYAASNADAAYRRARRVAVAHLGLSAFFLMAGMALAGWAQGRSALLEQWGIGAILLAVMIRKGIFPFHAWIPEIFERGRLGPAARFNAPQIGTYVALVLAVPRASAPLLHVFALLALLTAVYAALMALHQVDARRACGYLFVSQSAMVLGGVDLARREALAGALVLWISSGLAVAGLTRAVLALEARRGRLRLDARHGGYERMPQLAVSFLVLCLALANFPGTLGFVGGEMLVRGAVESFPALGLFAVAAGALNGLAAVRMYFSLFCGRRESGPHLRLGRAEVLGFSAAALVLLGFGLAPSGLVRVLSRAGEAVIESRAVHQGAIPDLRTAP